MIFAVLNILIALLLAFGAVQELVVRGIQRQETQPLVVGVAGIVVSLLFAISGIAIWRRQANARRLTIIAAIRKNATNCRQMLRRARKHISSPARFIASPEQLERLTNQFASSYQSGDVEGLVTLLS